MSSKPQQQQQKKQQPQAAGQKRKAEGNNGAQKQQQKQDQQPNKKVKEANGGAKPKHTNQGNGQQQKKPQQQQQKQGKKAAPTPVEEEEEDEDDLLAGDDDDDAQGEVDEVALSAIAKVEDAYEKILAEIEGHDAQESAEIYAIQKKYLLKKRPILAKRDALIAGVPGLWKKLFSEHNMFIAQMEEVDHQILDSLVGVSEDQEYSAAEKEKQQVTGLSYTFTFKENKELGIKAGTYKKKFIFDDEKEALMCVGVTEEKEMPFTQKFVKEHADSFFVLWFTSDGADDGILAAQDAISSELYAHPLQLFKHLAEGNPMPEQGDDDEDDDQNMLFGEDGEEDEEAPELVDE